MDWVDSLAMIGTIGMYDADSVKDLDTITGCTEHTELGKSSDGAYTYYLSLNKDADESLASELKEIQATLTEITPPQRFPLLISRRPRQAQIPQSAISR